MAFEDETVNSPIECMVDVEQVVAEGLPYFGDWNSKPIPVNAPSTYMIRDFGIGNS